MEPFTGMCSSSVELLSPREGAWAGMMVLEVVKTPPNLLSPLEGAWAGVMVLEVVKTPPNLECAEIAPWAPEGARELWVRPPPELMCAESARWAYDKAREWIFRYPPIPHMVSCSPSAVTLTRGVLTLKLCVFSVCPDGTCVRRVSTIGLRQSPGAGVSSPSPTSRGEFYYAWRSRGHDVS